MSLQRQTAEEKVNKHSLADSGSSAILTQLVRTGKRGMGGGDTEGHLARSPKWLGLTTFLDKSFSYLGKPSFVQGLACLLSLGDITSAWSPNSLLGQSACLSSCWSALLTAPLGADLSLGLIVCRVWLPLCFLQSVSQSGVSHFSPSQQHLGP